MPYVQMYVGALGIAPRGSLTYGGDVTIGGNMGNHELVHGWVVSVYVFGECAAYIRGRVGRGHVHRLGDDDGQPFSP